MARVKKEQAIKEVHAWLDIKKTKPYKREEMVDSIDLLAESISAGELKFDPETGIIHHELLFPVEDNEGMVITNSLTYKPRLKVHEVQNKLQKVKSNDIQGMIAVYVSAITGEAIGIIKNLDSEDYRISQAIAGFFF